MTIESHQTKIESFTQNVGSWTKTAESFSLRNMPQGAAEKIHKRVIANAVEETALKAKGIIKQSDIDLDNDQIPPELDEIVGDWFLNIIISLTKENAKHDNRIVVAHTDEAIFSNALDPRPIVATSGCGPCVAIAGYEDENKSGFVVHVSSEVFFNKSKEALTEKVLQMTTNSKPVHLHLRGGIEGLSEPLIEAIDHWIESMGSRVIVDSKDLRRFGAPEAMSICLDTRTGEVCPYYHIGSIAKNSFPLQSSLGTGVKIVYSG